MDTSVAEGLPEVSKLGFGIMRMPYARKGSKDIDFEKGVAMVDYAMDHGVTYFDTAYNYHGGFAEPFLGNVLKRYPRDSFNLTTKMPLWMISERREVEEIFETQLKTLQTEYFDFYLVHSLKETLLAKMEELDLYNFLAEKKREGRIRHLGFSFHGKPDALGALVDMHSWEFVQLQINYMDWIDQDAKRQYEIVRERNLPIMVMEPLKGGLLAELNENARAVLAEANPDASPASWGLRYVASLPGVITVLSGMSTLEQVQDNIRTFSPFRPIDDRERVALDKALAAYRSSCVIPCTACRYCMDCPAGVEIPTVFSVYNHYYDKPPRIFLFNDYIRALSDTQRADSCVGCGKCVEACPQKIDIPHWMSVVDAFMKENKVHEMKNNPPSKESKNT
ncbi:MAG: aldo/keto reductase [Planctomycetaceae bacterium]|nr:aldo/keto reductase [Planctomycetaceae bacterium]